MKRIFLLAVFAWIGLTACHQKEKMPSYPAPVTEASGVKVRITDLASDNDVVCGMKLEGQAIADTAIYRAMMYGFCSPECKAEFVKNPKSYLTQQ
jgi:YHS domain-containing protein